MTDSTDSQETLEIDLRNPYLAAFLAWLMPGAGHFYQRRFAKGFLFLVCILGTYVFGFSLGDGKVVYAQWLREDRRWQFVCQAGVGLPVLPALIQSYRDPHRAPFLVRQLLPEAMAPPAVEQDERIPDQLSDWHLNLTWRFELATLYTMVAGLLNVLAIYDAFAGPFITVAEDSGKSRRDPA